jgi:hypothetical protein
VHFLLYHVELYQLRGKVVLEASGRDHVELPQAVAETGIEVVELLLGPMERDEALDAAVAGVDDAIDDLMERGVWQRDLRWVSF